MSKLSVAQIGMYAVSAGLTTEQAYIAVAIALAESGGNTDSVGALGERGLWQIYPKAHPDWASKNLFDPAINAQAMVAISSHGTNWTPWTTYNNGAYKNYLDDAHSEDKNAYQGPQPAAIDKVIDPAKTAANNLNDLFNNLANPDFWIRIGKVALGAGLILIGLSIFAKPVISAAANVTPVGKLAKVVK